MEFADEGFSCDDDEVYTKNQSTDSSKPSSLQETQKKSYLLFILSFNVCPGSSDQTQNIESKYFIQLSSCDLTLFCSVN